MAEMQSTIAGAVLIGVLFGAFWWLWDQFGVDIHWAVDYVLPFVLALVVAFGVSVAYYAVRARMRTR